MPPAICTDATVDPIPLRMRATISNTRIREGLNNTPSVGDNTASPPG